MYIFDRNNKPYEQHRCRPKQGSEIQSLYCLGCRGIWNSWGENLRFSFPIGIFIGSGSYENVTIRDEYDEVQNRAPWPPTTGEKGDEPEPESIRFEGLWFYWDDAHGKFAKVGITPQLTIFFGS
ncbi:unnamed protein product [Clonostachys rhizophaga]|uniref:Uncharacterized protein n=1 Tax=Clonostachys rhizophaga TaxID=160324 RepID=A0A9N9V0G0_9HYPO|nr:unnamed protein product [Clonostachys rhizophaga]